MRRNDLLTHPVILGGGPAGAAAAIRLAQGGARPLIIERARETGDAICGGFVSWKTLASLRTLGLDAAALGGHPITQVRVFAGKRVATAPLPFRAIGISRRRLDGLLIDRAVNSGAGLERGVSVREIGKDGSVRLSGSSMIEAQSLFVAVGKHDVRGIARRRDTGEAQTIGLRAYLPRHPALTALIGDAIELHLFDGAYCGIQLNETGDANLCLAVRKSRLIEAGGDPARLLAMLGAQSPVFGERLAFFDPTLAIDAIAAVPYGWRTANTVAGQFRLGDQAAVIPSLAGEGNGIALASGIAAADAWVAGGPAAALPYQRDFARRTARPVAAASFLWHRGETRVGAMIATTVLARIPALAGWLASLTRIGA